MKIGLGTGRFFLAFLVVISHLWAGMLDGPAAYSVWGFYILSGFLMTHVLTHKYGNTREGLSDYARNRFLRIYPSYALAMLAGGISLVVLPRWGVQLSALNPQFNLPHGAREWMLNILLVPIPSPGLLVPVSGALAVEVGAYILMPLMAFSRPAAWISLILSMLINLKLGFGTDTFGERYSSFLTCYMVFACGCLLSQYREKLRHLQAPTLSIVVWLLHCLVWLKFNLWPWTYGIYFSIVLSAWVVLSLSAQKTGKLDAFLGDLSYPIYLFHTIVAVWLIPLGVKMRSFKFFLLAFIITIAVSWLIVKCVDKPLTRLKKKKVEMA
ncbi:acyltransferase [Herbaspirillum sp. RTI4]|uniref:acyltransferase family protein n=1 Tax=Herbaspirillum sp. RTI4 TaxID=3048640 RepID=UPI002AB34A50|nr:acyltransferase [Herbaspirillum sp. RTI4]MDY7577608.1 acyltransferase [Herbaspirillum sp. RTI4]MEA9983279.1 acyltransferase [Herbaspirillum sp. RTI4]